MEHINIKGGERVAGASSENGLISSTTWSASDGYARALELEKARLAVIEEQKKRQQEQHPLFMRMAALEREVLQMKAELKELKAE